MLKVDHFESNRGRVQRSNATMYRGYVVALLGKSARFFVAQADCIPLGGIRATEAAPKPPIWGALYKRYYIAQIIVQGTPHIFR
jgi:hypothetical protein